MGLFRASDRLLSGDGAEDFVEPARLQVKFFELQSLFAWRARIPLAGLLRLRAGSAVKRAIAYTNFNFGDRRKGGDGGAARGLQLVSLLQLQCHGVVVTGPGSERLRRVVRPRSDRAR